MGITGPTTWLGLVVVVALFYGAEGFVGIIWRRMSVQRLLPSQVVDLMLQNGIKNMRIPHSVRHLESLPGQRDQSHPYLVQRQPASRHVSVHRGRNLLLQLGRLVCPDYDLNWGALNYVQTALNEVGLGRTKANIVHCAAELIPNITNPSEAAFHDIIKDRMSQFLRFMRQHNAPFQVDLDPSPTSSAAASTLALPSQTTNQNLSSMISTVPSTPMGSIGSTTTSYGRSRSLTSLTSRLLSWRWAGPPTATLERALTTLSVTISTYCRWSHPTRAPSCARGLPLMCLLTPQLMSPSRGLTCSLLSIAIWGIYSRGRDIYPTTVKGIMHMPKRWCVFNGNSTDKDKVRRQDEKACNFEGLSCITDQDPSTEDCLFPVEVVLCNDYVSVHSIIESRDADFGSENRFTSLPKPKGMIASSSNYDVTTK
ncbi:hypothetical protein SASPL_111353 [Salvia splendens]|uniref:Uncharacterized protein n=1 Tax=Salvia splendens TaxID=180675 RepID=A0A8X8YCB0_SALSN|nr:hypothetical protein SASPL_111353 [Salvia splendens]